MQYSYRSSLLSDSPTLAIAAKAKRLIAEGIDIVSFSAGQPDFPTPEAIKAAGIEAIDRNVTGYTASSGTPRLRGLVAEWMTREVGVDYAPNQIIVSTGAKFALVAAILATVNPGDEVLFAAPYWVSYTEMVKLAGAEPRPIMTVRASGFKLSPEALESSIGRETKMLMLNSPNNPTGAVYSRAELEALADVLARHPDVWVLSDEIYSRLIFGGKKHVSIAAISPDIAARTIVINGVSKTFAMTGWRIGWAAGPAELISRAGKIQSHTTSCPNSIAQYAAERALAADDS
ncbi:pyridoxal phosphate-dependent aminotransferase, partial [bacterium]|nr:pyridoxal phosphate-dependent aminotransferase [bacterium]